MVIDHSLRGQRLAELRDVVSGPGRVTRQTLPAFIEADRSGKDVYDRGVEAAPTVLAELVEARSHLVWDAPNRKLLRHACMIAWNSIHVC
jgi:hypothetical protein